MTMGLRIKTQRNKINLTQTDLAKRLGLGIDMVKQLESDRKKPSIETLEKLSDIFNCTTDYLLGKEKTDPFDFTDAELEQVVKDFAKGMEDESEESLEKIRVNLKEFLQVAKKNK